MTRLQEAELPRTDRAREQLDQALQRAYEGACTDAGIGLETLTRIRRRKHDPEGARMLVEFLFTAPAGVCQIPEDFWGSPLGQELRSHLDGEPVGWLSVVEAAEALGVTRIQVQRLLRETTHLPNARRERAPGRGGWRWLIPASDVAAYRERQRQRVGVEPIR